MSIPQFNPKAKLVNLIESYFALTLYGAKDMLQEPPTITGLALHVGFKSKEDFELYEIRGKFRTALKQARLRIIGYYESRLLYPSPAGAIFALKSMGWDAKPVNKPISITSIKVELVETGPQPASSEKEVDLNTVNNVIKKL